MFRVHLRKRTLRIVEFLIIGVLFGLVEDLIAVKSVSDVSIDFRVVITILAVAIPFAIISELIVDHPRFWETIRLRKQEEENDQFK